MDQLTQLQKESLTCLVLQELVTHDIHGNQISASTIEFDDDVSGTLALVILSGAGAFNMRIME